MIIITSPNASDIAEFLFGPPQHHAHVMAHRRVRYIADRDAENAIRLQNVEAELALMIAEVRQRRAPMRQAAE
jgi:hypothetical protein